MWIRAVPAETIWPSLFAVVSAQRTSFLPALAGMPVVMPSHTLPMMSNWVPPRISMA